MSKLDWGEARVQITIAQSKIEDFLREGRSFVYIYRSLKNAGEYKGGQRTFERHAAAIKAKMETREGVEDMRPTKMFSDKKPVDKTGQLDNTFTHDASGKNALKIWE